MHVQRNMPASWSSGLVSKHGIVLFQTDAFNARINLLPCYNNVWTKESGTVFLKLLLETEAVKIH